MDSETRVTVKDGIYNYAPAIKGKGRMTGKQFADECRKVWSEENKVNARYYGLFEKHVISIEAKRNGVINARLA